MEWSRAVSVECAGTVGAGCVVAPGLVLTAHHVVAPAEEWEDEPVTVRPLSQGGDGPAAQAEVAWHYRDAALLSVRPHDLGQEFAPVRWGELTCINPPQSPKCSAVGLPRAAVRGDRQGAGSGYRAEHMVAGVINVVDNAARTYSLQVDREPPDDSAGAGSPWQGMSGAGVFCDDLLIGVIIEDPGGWNNARLEALPVRRLLDDRRFHALVANASGMAPVLEPADLDVLFDHRPQPAAAASYLLSPRSEVVPFTGLDREMTRLVDWCTSAARTVDVAVVHGPGGVGKTRLAVELARRVSERRPEAEQEAGSPDMPWTAGFLQLDTAASSPFPPSRMLRNLIRPVLVIVDYAESRRAQLMRLLDNLTTHRAPGNRVRILLLARSVPQWWEELRAGYGPTTRGPLIELSTGGLYRQQDRHQAREQAVLAFSRRLAELRWADLPDDWDPEQIADLISAAGDPPVYDASGTLAVQMDALAGVLLHTPDGLEDDLSPAKVLLAHEIKHWDRAFHAGGLGHLPLELRRALVAVQRMAHAKNEDQALAAIRTAWDFHYRKFTDHPLGADTHQAILHTLQDLYPSTDGSYWGGFGPDILTGALIDELEDASDEHFLTEVLPSPHLDTTQREHCLTIVARSIPTQPHLRDSAAFVIAANPDTLMDLADEVTIQLPEADRDAWIDALTEAEVEAEAEADAGRAAASTAADTPKIISGMTQSSRPTDAAPGSGHPPLVFTDLPRVPESVRIPARPLPRPVPPQPSAFPPAVFYQPSHRRGRAVVLLLLLLAISIGIAIWIGADGAA